MENHDEFFRTLIALDNGERMYETANGKIVCRKADRIRSLEMMQRTMVTRENVAFAPEFHTLRPAWAFPGGTEIHRVVQFLNEPAELPLCPSAHSLLGEPITDQTAYVYVG
jgi:hypothetical protein